MKRHWARAALFVGCIALFMVATAHAAESADKRRDERSSVVGAWRLTVKPDLFDAIWVFHQGGTITERTANGPSAGGPAGITAGSGVWKRVRGGRVAGMIEGFIDPNQDGSFELRYRVRVTVKVRGHHLDGTATLEVFPIDGGPPILGPDQFDIEASRMRVIRE